MARKAKSGTNKSAAIRDYKTANPTASPQGDCRCDQQIGPRGFGTVRQRY